MPDGLLYCPPFFYWTGSLTEPILNHLSSTAYQQAPRTHLFLLTTAGVKDTHYHTSFSMCAEDLSSSISSHVCTVPSEPSPQTLCVVVFVVCLTWGSLCSASWPGTNICPACMEKLKGSFKDSPCHKMRLQIGDFSRERTECHHITCTSISFYEKVVLRKRVSRKIWVASFGAALQGTELVRISV